MMRRSRPRAAFALTVIEGVLEILGISTPSERLQHMVREHAQIPNIQCGTESSNRARPHFTADTLVCVMRTLYSFGLLSRALWWAVSKLSWRAAAKIVGVVGLVARAASSQEAMLVFNAVKLVVELVAQIGEYSHACPSQALQGEASLPNGTGNWSRQRVVEADASW